MDQLLTSKLSIVLLEKIADKTIPNDSAMTIIAKGMELLDTFPNMTGAQKQAMLVNVLEKVAAGKDGILGTSDDIISKEAVTTIRLILDKNLLKEITKVIVDTSKGNFNINHALEVAETTGKVCLPLVSKCFSGKKK